VATRGAFVANNGTKVLVAGGQHFGVKDLIEEKKSFWRAMEAIYRAEKGGTSVFHSKYT
jgi:hypothetical protein